jgi:ribonucleoside-diphosphate reductase alpha chain
MPSMRAFMTAGPAAERSNVCVYNCAYTPIEKPRRFAEILYILTCGTGVGFSVERRYTQRLPVVPKLHEQLTLVADPFLTDSTYHQWVVEDSNVGWAEAFDFLISELYAGNIPSFDYSVIRREGARLKTMGGRASGPDPLRKLFEFTVETFRRAQGRRLEPIEVHDIACMTGEVVVVGGVRRSAMISLFDRDDVAMRTAKSGEWWKTHPWRALSNNSAVYEERPDPGTFMQDWTDLYKSYSGEPGIFNRDACNRIARQLRRRTNVEFGTNPCSEIILRPQQFCNLTEIVVRPDDELPDLKRKARLAAILGTLQARLTKFPFLSQEWSTTTEDEALIGVSQTGIYDRRPWNEWELEQAKRVVAETNAGWAAKLGINVSAAGTCVKPSGTVSQLVDAASGLHARHAPFFLRRVRADAKDPLSQLLAAEGVPWEWERGKEGQTMVFSFPMRSPKGAMTRDKLSAVGHLQAWLKYQRSWCEHKPSITVSIREDEWFEVAQFVWEHFDSMSGVAFLPYDGGTYVQAPYEEIDEETYTRLAADMPTINWDRLREFEFEDNTAGSQTMACTGGVCEIVDL